MKTVEEIIKESEKIARTQKDQAVIAMMKSIAAAAQREERSFIIYRGEELAGMYLDGPLRDSVYAIFEKLKELPYGIGEERTIEA